MWREDVFNNLVRLNRGFDLPEEKIVPGAFPVVASSSVKSFHKEFKVRGPGVVTGRSGSLGVVQYIRADFWPLNTALYAKDFKGNLPVFVCYFLKVMGLENFNSGAGVPTLNQNHLQKLKIKIPSLPVQKKIAAILSAYDDLIENNKRRIALLEKMAEEIYREWFVRMRFPGHEKVKMVKGVPEGWEVRSIASISDEIRKGIKKKNLSGEEKYLGLEHIPRKSIVVTEFAYADSVDSDKLQFQEGDILFGKIRPYLHKVAIAHFSGVCSTDTIVIRSKNKIFEGFLLFTVFSETFVDLATTASTGTKMPRADWDFLKKLEIKIPDENLTKQFQKIFDEIFSQIVCLSKSNDKLITIRDMLLPRLISGKLSVENLDIQFPPSMREEIAKQPVSQMVEPTYG